MKRWNVAVRDAVWSGSVASALSTVALALRGRRETGSPAAPTNAISHWVWGDVASRHDELSTRYTLLGYGIHHVASVFWAAFYERWFGDRVSRGEVAHAAAGSLGVAALACFVDYRMTPHRLQPGYEMRLSTPSLALVYGAVGAGLLLASLLREGGAGRDAATPGPRDRRGAAGVSARAALAAR